MSNIILTPKASESSKSTNEHLPASSSATQNNNQKRVKLDEKGKSLDYKNKIPNINNHHQTQFKNSKSSTNTSINENISSTPAHALSNKNTRPGTLLSDSNSDTTKFEQKSFFNDPEFQRIIPNQLFSNPNPFNFTNQLFLNTQQSLTNNFNYKSAFTSPSSLRQPPLSNEHNKESKRDNTHERKLCNALNIENLVSNDTTKTGASSPSLQSSQQSVMSSGMLNSRLASLQHQLYQQIQSLQSNTFYQFNSAQKPNNFQHYFNQ